MKTAFALAEKLKPRLANEFQRRLLAATMQSVQEASNPLPVEQLLCVLPGVVSPRPG